MRRLILVAMLFATPAMADPFLYRPNDMELFKQDVHEANKLRAIKLSEQRAREDQIERERKLLVRPDHREIAKEGN